MDVSASDVSSRRNTRGNARNNTNGSGQVNKHKLNDRKIGQLAEFFARTEMNRDNDGRVLFDNNGSFVKHSYTVAASSSAAHPLSAQSHAHTHAQSHGNNEAGEKPCETEGEDDDGASKEFDYMSSWSWWGIREDTVLQHYTPNTPPLSPTAAEEEAEVQTGQGSHSQSQSRGNSVSGEASSSSYSQRSHDQSQSQTQTSQLQQSHSLSFGEDETRKGNNSKSKSKSKSKSRSRSRSRSGSGRG